MNRPAGRPSERTIGATTCPGCGASAWVFHRRFRAPGGRPVYGIGLHGPTEPPLCPGVGRRVAPADITPLADVPAA